MAIEHIPYEGSVNEARDEDRANAQESGLVAAAHQFEDGTGAPLYAPQDELWQDEGTEDEYQDEGDEFVDAEAYDAPAEPTTLLEAARLEVQGLSPEEMAVVAQSWPADVQAAIVQEAAAEQARAQADAQTHQLASTFEARTQYQAQRAALEQQRGEDAEAIGSERGFELIDAMAREQGAKVDAEQIFEQAEQALSRVASMWRHEGATAEQVAQLYDPATIEQVLSELVAEAAAVERHREMLISTRTGLGPYPLGNHPTGSWIRPPE